MTKSRPPRYAIYFTAAPGSPLARFGAGIVGYDSDSRNDVPRLTLNGVPAADLIAATQAPRRYGFHATLVAPFYLDDQGEDRLREAVEQFAGQTASAPIGRLAVNTIAGFIAFTPHEASPAVSRLAARCVEFFERFRAPLSADDLARRSAGDLSARQRRNLERWGYPYVFDDFRFHMTLTGKLAPDDRPRFHEALTEAFLPIADATHHIDSVSLMRQSDPETSFEVVTRRGLHL
jgi:putative phosphonate metabolism protein